MYPYDKSKTIEDVLEYLYTGEKKDLAQVVIELLKSNQRFDAQNELLMSKNNPPVVLHGEELGR